MGEKRVKQSIKSRGRYFEQFGSFKKRADRFIWLTVKGKSISVTGSEGQ
jgi:hypothetical protein